MWAITFQSVFLTRVTPYPGSGANTSFFRVFPQPPENGYCVWSPLVLNLPKVGMRDSLMPYDSCDDLFHNLSLAELLKTYRDEPRVETRFFFSSVFFYEFNIKRIVITWRIYSIWLDLSERTAHFVYHQSSRALLVSFKNDTIPAEYLNTYLHANLRYLREVCVHNSVNLHRWQTSLVSSICRRRVLYIASV